MSDTGSSTDSCTACARAALAAWAVSFALPITPTESWYSFAYGMLERAYALPFMLPCLTNVLVVVLLFRPRRQTGEVLVLTALGGWGGLVGLGCLVEGLRLGIGFHVWAASAIAFGLAMRAGCEGVRLGVVGLELDLGQPAEQAIEPAGGEQLQPPLAGPRPTISPKAYFPSTARRSSRFSRRRESVASRRRALATPMATWVPRIFR